MLVKLRRMPLGRGAMADGGRWTEAEGPRVCAWWFPPRPVGAGVTELLATALPQT